MVDKFIGSEVSLKGEMSTPSTKIKFYVKCREKYREMRAMACSECFECRPQESDLVDTLQALHFASFHAEHQVDLALLMSSYQIG